MGSLQQSGNVDDSITVGQAECIKNINAIINHFASTGDGGRTSNALFLIPFFHRPHCYIPAPQYIGVYVLKGTSGVGKTHMLYYLKDLASNENIATVMSSASIEECYTPYFSIRGILRKLLNMESAYFGSLESDDKVSYIKFQLRSTFNHHLKSRRESFPKLDLGPVEEKEQLQMEDFVSSLPLLKDALDLDLHIPLTSKLLQMDAIDRGTKVQDLVFFILGLLKNVTITIENADYMDDLTYLLLKRFQSLYFSWPL